MTLSWRKTWPLMAVLMAILSTAYAEQGGPSSCDLHPLDQAPAIKVFTNCVANRGKNPSVEIRGDDFSFLKPSHFSRLNQIVSLSIVGTPQNLMPMDTRIFGMLPKLESLKLKNIDLSNAPKKFLAGLQQLRHVELINCNLSEFPDFESEPILILDLSHNRIRALPKNLPVGPPLDKGTIQMMDWSLKGNQISDISSQVEALSLAANLDISDNSILPLPCDKQITLLRYGNNDSLRKGLTIDTRSVNMDSSCDLSKFKIPGFLRLNGGSASDFSKEFSRALHDRSDELILSNFSANNGLSSIINQTPGRTIHLVNSDLTNLDFNDPLWRDKKINVILEDDSTDSLPSVFNGSQSVISISIKMPHLHFVPENMFKEMSNLVELNFRDTPLTKTSKATFRGIQVFGLPTNFGVTETGGTSEEWAP